MVNMRFPRGVSALSGEAASKDEARRANVAGWLLGQ